MDEEEDQRAAPSPSDLARAYTELNKEIGGAISGPAIESILGQFRLDAGIASSIAKQFSSSIDPTILSGWNTPLLPASEPLEFDTTPLRAIRPVTMDIAESADRAAELMQLQHEAIAQLVSLTAANLQHAEAQRASAERTERFTRFMSWSSLVVAIGSLAAAVVAVFVSVVPQAG